MKPSGCPTAGREVYDLSPIARLTLLYTLPFTPICYTPMTLPLNDLHQIAQVFAVSQGGSSSIIGEWRPNHSAIREYNAMTVQASRTLAMQSLPTVTPPPIERSRPTPESDVRPLSPSRATRILHGGLGILSIVIATIGVALPGIPTTGPLIAASFFLAKSNPRLEKKLLGLKIFAIYMRYLDGSTPMPRRARVWALAWMWASILISCYLFSHATHLRGAKIGGTLAMGCIGTVAITQYRRSAG